MSEKRELLGLDVIPNDIFLNILSFLWIDDVLNSLVLVNKDIYLKINSMKVFFLHEKIKFLFGAFNKNVDTFITGNNGRTSQSEPRLHLEMNDTKQLTLLLKKMTVMPSNFDFRTLLPIHYRLDRILEVNISGNKNHRGIVYHGYNRGGNRSIVADHHFPVLPMSFSRRRIPQSGIISRICQPFTKFHCTQDAQGVQFEPLLSLVAYFEISIHNPISPPRLSTERLSALSTMQAMEASSDPCVCIGLCLAGFSVAWNMPGWKSNSFGYHVRGSHFVESSFLLMCVN